MNTPYYTLNGIVLLGVNQNGNLPTIADFYFAILQNDIVGWLVDWGLTSHQQLRSYGDGTSVYSPIRRTGEARDRNCDPWFTRRVKMTLCGDGNITFCSREPFLL